MTSQTKELLLLGFALSFAAASASAGEITIHGASWGEAAAAPAPVAVVTPTRQPDASDVSFQPRPAEYGRNIAYGRKIRYAGSFRWENTKRDQRPYRIQNNIQYGDKLDPTRSFYRRPLRFRPSDRQPYGNKIRYGHGQGYSLGRRR